MSDIGVCLSFIHAGFGVTLLSLTLAAMNAHLPQPMPYTVETDMPFNFIGMGTVLIGIGRQLYTLHLKILLMDEMKDDEIMEAQDES